MYEKRAFFVALGVPRGVDTEQVRVAYRRVVTRYRRALDGDSVLDEPTEPPLSFAVMRSYSERRHAALFDRPEPLIPAQSEVDRHFDGFVPEAEPLRARRDGKDLYVELRLTGYEARSGGLFPIHIPVVRSCPACRDAAAEEQRLSCTLCHGSGRITEDRMVEVTAPPGVTDGRLARVAMEDVGLGDTDLLVRVIVER